MIIGTAILVFSLLFYFFVSSAILYHIIRYSPDPKGKFSLIGVYLGVSVALIIFVIAAFAGIDWGEID